MQPKKIKDIGRRLASNRQEKNKKTKDHDIGCAKPMSS
jgi:hypothetical protein